MKILIYGAGISAIAALKALKGADVVVKKEEVNNELYQLITSLNGHLLTTNNIIIDELYTYDYIVRSPGINRFDHFLKLLYFHNLPVISEIELGYLLAPQATYIAITGSNGKTTTCQLLYQMLKRGKKKVYLAGNIGIPLTSIVSLLDHQSIVILELSSFQLENISCFKPSIAAITNLSPNHLDACGDLDFYYSSKMKILNNLTGYFFLNETDATITKLLPRKSINIIGFGQESSVVAIKNEQIYINNLLFIKKSAITILGEHNLLNIALASAIAFSLGISKNNVNKAVKEFSLPPFRLTLVKEVQGISFYNDSKSTTPEATLMALKALKNKNIILLLGGKDKKVSYHILKDVNCQIIAYGEIANIAKQQLNCLVEQDLTAAFNKAISLAKRNDVILFSPGASSYDQFKNYQQRGQFFNDLVNNI